jgi:hypothetical protein
LFGSEEFCILREIWLESVKTLQGRSRSGLKATWKATFLLREATLS